jgi:hypothetical protein
MAQLNPATLVGLVVSLLLAVVAGTLMVDLQRPVSSAQPPMSPSIDTAPTARAASATTSPRGESTTRSTDVGATNVETGDVAPIAVDPDATESEIAAQIEESTRTAARQAHEVTVTTATALDDRFATDFERQTILVEVEDVDQHTAAAIALTNFFATTFPSDADATIDELEALLAELTELEAVTAEFALQLEDPATAADTLISTSIEAGEAASEVREQAVAWNQRLDAVRAAR